MVQSFILGPASNTCSAAFTSMRAAIVWARLRRRSSGSFQSTLVSGSVESVDRPDVAGLGLKVCRALRATVLPNGLKQDHDGETQVD